MGLAKGLTTSWKQWCCVPPKGMWAKVEQKLLNWRVHAGTSRMYGPHLELWAVYERETTRGRDSVFWCHAPGSNPGGPEDGNEGGCCPLLPLVGGQERVAQKLCSGASEADPDERPEVAWPPDTTPLEEASIGAYFKTLRIGTMD